MCFFSLLQLFRLSPLTRRFFSLFGPSPVSLALATNLFTPRVPQAPNNYNLGCWILLLFLVGVELEFGAVGFSCMYCGLLSQVALFGFGIDNVRAST